MQLAKTPKLPVLDHEPGFLLSDTVSGDKPADVFFGNWKLGMGLCVDVCIANSLELSSGHAGVYDGMAPLKKKVDLKRNKYEARCRERGYLFKPFVWWFL